MQNVMAAFRVVVVAAFVAACFPAQAVAQQWTPEQQEVIDSLEQCWDIWTEGVQSGAGIEAWLEQCAAPDYSYWWDTGVPAGREEDRRYQAIAPEENLGWVALQPVVVNIYDDIAIMHFFGSWWVSPGESMATAKRTEVFRRIDGRWKLIAGHSTPFEQ